MKELNGKRIVVLSPAMMVNMFMNSYRTNYTYYDEVITAPKVKKSRIYNSSTEPYKERKLTKKKSQR